MTWTEAKRKKIWGNKFNPAVTMGLFLMIASLYGGIIFIILGLILLFSGFKMYKKYGYK
jgi:hypothetical protein